MGMLDTPSWRWGLILIALTMAIHATGIVTMAFVGVRVRARLESRGLESLRLVALLIFTSVAMVLLLAILHGAECGIWAAAYLWLGALESPGEALLYSVDSMATRGASGLTLQRHWQMMGALEAVDGVLLFGVSTAYMFAVMQTYWSLLAAQMAQATTGARERTYPKAIKRAMGVSTKTAKNEQRKLTATFFNNIAVGCVLLGLIGPLATGKYGHFLTLEFVYSEGAAWVLAAVLHLVARRQLAHLEE